MGFANQDQHKHLAKKLMTKIDSDGVPDGKVSLAEFKKLMWGQVVSRDPEKEIRATFSWLCNYDPTVSKVGIDRLREKTHALQLGLTDEELHDMIRDADRDDDKSVDQEEYICILKHAVWI